MKRRTGLIGAVALVATGLALLGATQVSDRLAGERHIAATTPSPSLIERGAYLAQLGDCAACHSVPGRPPFTGGLAMRIPVGAIYTTNITFDKKEGIDSYTLADFDRALRFGVSRGHTLYPAMPFPSYANLRPDDVQALYAYFRYGVKPSATPNVANAVPFPLSLRFPLTMWRWLYAPRARPFVAAPGADTELADGAYFVEGLGHCGECHTPRGIGMQVKAQTAQDGEAFLSGGRVDNWFAPSLRSGAGQGTLHDWSEADLAAFLRNGVNRDAIAFGSMSDVIEHSTQHMTDHDALAAARFLKSLDAARPGPAFAYDQATDAALRQGHVAQRGAQVYLDNCAACHRPDGRGYEGVFPALAGNPVVNASDPASIVSIVLQGSLTVHTRQAPAQFQMPSFAWRLSDQDIADVTSFVRDSWGNHAAAVDAAAVAPLRRDAKATDGITEPTDGKEMPREFSLKPANASVLPSGTDIH